MSIYNPSQSTSTGVLNAQASVADVNQTSNTANTWTDTLQTVNIVTTKVCTIRAWATGAGFVTTDGHLLQFRLMINGTAGSSQTHEINGAAGALPFSLVGRKTGVAAGTITVKVQMIGDGDTIIHLGPDSTGDKACGNFLLVDAVVE